MEAVYVLLLMAALTRAADSVYPRTNVFVNSNSTWTDALMFCRSKYVDLSSIVSPADDLKFREDTRDSCKKGCWIGLSKDANQLNFTRWSDGTAVGITLWTNGEPNNMFNENCVTTSGSSWNNNKCTRSYPFVCYTWVLQVVVVQELKTWTEALEHCRTFYKDLISLTTDSKELVANNTWKLQTPDFWTGLRFLDGSWFWSHMKPAENLTSLPSCPVRPHWCGAQNTKNGVLENRDCEEKLNFMCSL